jgi:stage III sporulation protein SpoIIIAA
MERRITDDIHELMRVFPAHINDRLEALGQIDNLIEIVLDLGRVPTARYTTGEIPLSESEVTRIELDQITSRVGAFDADNRAGIERTLHRISAIRNRRGEIVGLTCRVGRAVFGTIDIIQDLIESGQSVLLLGSPGVGKTTMLREAARVLAASKRVVIVDTSNEIGGDGDVPHPAIGRARRMQVSHPERQHEVMIEAVENHNPEVIVIDEIGREMEALAARTIAERGVQLIATAHGSALENLLLNPTLSDLVGGIQSVTLSDEEARRRGTQKTVLERRAPPTFDVLIEIQTRDRLVVHEDVALAVDTLLRDRPLHVERRSRNEQGEITIEAAQTEMRLINERNERRDETGHRYENGHRRGRDHGENYRGGAQHNDRSERSRRGRFDAEAAMREQEDERLNQLGEGMNGTPLAASGGKMRALKVYPYGVARVRLQQAARRLRVPLTIVDDEDDADIILTLKNYYRRRPKVIVDAERRGTSIYVLRASTVSQMESFLIDVFEPELGSQADEPEEDPFAGAMREAKEAIMLVRSGMTYVDLTPQSTSIRRRQHELARRAHLESVSFGDEPERYVRIMRREA